MMFVPISILNLLEYTTNMKIEWIVRLHDNQEPLNTQVRKRQITEQSIHSFDLQKQWVRFMSPSHFYTF